MSNLEVFCVVLAGGGVGGLIAWLSWSMGRKDGCREYNTDAIKSAVHFRNQALYHEQKSIR